MKRLFLFVFCGMLCAASCSEKADGIVASGTTGPLKWSLSADSVLTISGKGAMLEYSYYKDGIYPPWHKYRIDGITGVIIDDDVTSIGIAAFSGCEKMVSVSIGNSVTVIGNGAFDNCYSLMSVNIPNSVTSIGVAAFSHCYSLTSVTVGNSVSAIGDIAFAECGSLTSVIIGGSVTVIGDNAFAGCGSLATIVNHHQTPQMIRDYISGSTYSSVFAGVNKTDCTLFVPAGSVDAYRAAEVWKDFKNIEAIR